MTSSFWIHTRLSISTLFLASLILGQTPAIAQQIQSEAEITSQGSENDHETERKRLRAAGDSLRAAGEIEGALRAYLDAYRLPGALDDQAQNGLEYTLASTFALQPNLVDSAFIYLDMALPGLSSMQVLYDPDFYFLVSDKRWKDVENTMLDRLGSKVSGAFDRELARKLFTIRRNEWIGRYHIMLTFRQSNGTSPVLSLLADAMQQRHLKNEVELKAILNESGWPFISAVGSEAAYAAGNVLTHMDLAMRTKYLPLLEIACAAGEANWSDYAHAYDRTELESGRAQLYGTQMEWSDEQEAYVPQDLADPTNVEQRRAEKGLETLVQQLEKFNKAMKRDFGGGN